MLEMLPKTTKICAKPSIPRPDCLEIWHVMNSRKPLPQFLPLQSVAAISTPAFSTPAISAFPYGGRENERSEGGQRKNGELAPWLL